MNEPPKGSSRTESRMQEGTKTSDPKPAKRGRKKKQARQKKDLKLEDVYVFKDSEAYFQEAKTKIKASQRYTLSTIRSNPETLENLRGEFYIYDTKGILIYSNITYQTDKSKGLTEYYSVICGLESTIKLGVRRIIP